MIRDRAHINETIGIDQEELKELCNQRLIIKDESRWVA